MRIQAIAAFGVVVAASLATVSCQTLNQAECQTAGWYELGQRDGVEGRAVTHVARHLEACSRYGMSVDDAAWRAGWEKGIRQYCVPENGLSLGLSGASQSSSCPADMAQPFMQAYTVGRRVYDARAERDRIQTELSDLNRRMVEAKTQEERASLSSQVILKQNDLLMSERRLRDAEWELETYRRQAAGLVN
jgi:hypothetical protein